MKKGLLKEDGCLYPGALDLTNCIGAPVIMTLPHMMDIDPRYSRLIQGMKPNPDDHKIVIYVEPVK